MTVETPSPLNPPALSNHNPSLCKTCHSKQGGLISENVSNWEEVHSMNSLLRGVSVVVTTRVQPTASQQPAVSAHTTSKFKKGNGHNGTLRQRAFSSDLLLIRQTLQQEIFFLSTWACKNRGSFEMVTFTSISFHFRIVLFLVSATSPRPSIKYYWCAIVLRDFLCSQ